MACINMFNNDQQSLHLGPRISFSNDFADSQQPIKHENNYREAPVSSDFEFTVSGDDMISADEIFSKGKIVPLKKNSSKTTLKDELLVDDDYMDLSGRLNKGNGWWSGRFGLKRSHISNKKADNKVVDCLERIDETMTTISFHGGDSTNVKGCY